MIRWSLQQAAEATGGRLVNASGSLEFVGVSRDSRDLPSACLYVALIGERFDGHAFVEQALAAGAAAALVDEEHAAALSGPLLVVDDTRLALGRLAKAWGARWKGLHPGHMAALTGSNGKTTVKGLCASILSECGRVHATAGNLNNDIGVPLTLLGLDDAHQFAVIEMGANHAGEIAYLTDLVGPDAALLNNAGPAHLEGFGSLRGVAEAKAEIWQGLAQDAVAVINAEDDFAPFWRERVGQRPRLEFALQEELTTTSSDVAGAYVADADGLSLSLRLPAGDSTRTCQARLRLMGRHNALNATAAAALAVAVGASADAVCAGLAKASSVAGRLDLRRVNGRLFLLDDSYNANPASLSAGIDALLVQAGSPCLVLGDMAELGDEAESWHLRMGEQARRAGVARLYAVGELSRASVNGFGEGGRWFEHLDGLLEALVEDWQRAAPEAWGCLVKGSRSARMERVVEALVTRLSDEPLLGEGC